MIQVGDLVVFKNKERRRLADIYDGRRDRRGVFRVVSIEGEGYLIWHRGRAEHYGPVVLLDRTETTKVFGTNPVGAAPGQLRIVKRKKKRIEELVPAPWHRRSGV